MTVLRAMTSLARPAAGAVQEARSPKTSAYDGKHFCQRQVKEKHMFNHGKYVVDRHRIGLVTMAMERNAEKVSAMKPRIVRQAAGFGRWSESPMCRTHVAPLPDTSGTTRRNATTYPSRTMDQHRQSPWSLARMQGQILLAEGTQHPLSNHEASCANEGSRASLLEHTPIATEARSALLTPLIEKALSRLVVRYARTGARSKL